MNLKLLISFALFFFPVEKIGVDKIIYIKAVSCKNVL